MTDIRNSINLDASQAIGELGRLDRQLDVVNASMSQFVVTSSGTIQTPFEQMTRSAKAAGAAGAKATGDIGKGAAAASKPIRGMGLAFGDVVRIVQSQILFAAIAELRQGFFEAADAAAELQLQVAAIEAIAPDFSNARQEVEQLAIDLGRPLEEIGEATFEALQNDIGTTAETMEILRTQAQDLALVTRGTLPQAVNALSSIFKSYNLTQAETEAVSGKLFGTINAGRVTLADLENSLGTLSPLAQQAGISLGDMLDALATITLTGTKASVATTQLRNVFNKAIKPTEALKDVYQDLGVTGFRQLVEQTGGLVPALQAVTGAVGDDEQAVAKLFNRIRGNLGVLNVLTKEGELFEETARRSAIAAEDLGRAIDNIESTAARDAARNAAELEVIFTQIGDRALDTKNAVADLFLTFIDNGDEAIITATAFGTAITGAAIAVKGFGVTLSTAALPLAGFVAGFAATTAIIEFLESLNEEAKGLQDTLERFEVNSLQEVVDTLDRINAGEIDDANEAFENTESILNSVADAAIEAGNEIERAFAQDISGIEGIEEDILQRFAEGRLRIIDEIGDAIKDIDDEIAGGLQNIVDIQQELDEFKFERSIRNLTDFEKAARRLEKSATDVAEAWQLTERVGLGEESRKAAEAANDFALSSAKAALTAAKRAGDETQIAVASNRIETALQNQIRFEERLNELRGEISQKQLLQQKQALEALTAEQREQVEQALEARAAVEDAATSGAAPDVLAGLEQEFRDRLEAALSGLDAFSESEIVEKFGFEKASEVLNKNLRDGLELTNIDWTNAISSLRTSLAESNDLEAAVLLKAQIDEQALSVELHRAIAFATRDGGNAGEQLEQTAGAVKQIFDEQQGLANQIERDAESAKQNAAEAVALLQQAQDIRVGPGGRDDPGGARLAKAIAQPTIDALSNLGAKGEEELVGLQTALINGVKAVQETSTGLFGDLSDTRKDDLVQGLNNAIDAVQQRLSVIRGEGIFSQQTLEETRGILDGLNQEILLDVDDSNIREANRQLDGTKQKADNAAQSTGSIGTSAAVAVGGVSSLSSTTGGLAEQARIASQAFNQMAAAAQAAAAAARDAASAGASGFAYHGGVQYLAGGGAARGQDTINTMLSPGEFVTNARQARNFLPELQAINSGNAISSSGNGGDTNITIGDINVNSTSQLPSQTAREVGHSIKRELRRGTFRL